MTRAKTAGVVAGVSTLDQESGDIDLSEIELGSLVDATATTVETQVG